MSTAAPTATTATGTATATTTTTNTATVTTDLRNLRRGVDQVPDVTV